MLTVKDRQKKLLRAEVAGRTMEYLMGLNEKNIPAIIRVVEKASKKIVAAYYQAIKQQYKKALGQTAKKDKVNKELTVAEPVVVAKQTNLKAC